MFQSLKGLQPKWNIDPKTTEVLQLVSIPKRVTAKVELEAIGCDEFQQLVSIPKRVTAKVEHRLITRGFAPAPFQSLKGLQPKWNVAINLGSLAIEIVSIPKRVTAKVERIMEASICNNLLFQSLKGLQPKWNIYYFHSTLFGACFNP